MQEPLQGQSLPKYVQIAELLIRDIAAGRYPDGARLPPERALAQSLGTTVTTLRKSLMIMEEKGLVRRVQGSGNYVQLRSDVDSVYNFFRVELVSGGGLPTARLLSLDSGRKPAGLPAFGQSEKAHRIRRLRLLSDVPCVLEEIWLDGSYTSDLNAHELSESLYLYYREALGLWISSVEDRIALGTVPSWAPVGFGLAPDAPCVWVERWSQGQDGAVAEYSRSWIDTSVARYVARIS